MSTIHILCCCSNSGSSIYNTLLTWKAADAFHVLINNTTDNTLDEIGRTGLLVNVHYGAFENFSQIRNQLIDTVEKELEGRDHIFIMIDDSYELPPSASLDPLRKLILPHVPLGISFKILHRGVVFNKVIGMTKGVRFDGDVHEVPIVDHLVNLSIPVIDRLYDDQIERTLSRKCYDLETLSSLVDPRSKFYKVIKHGTVDHLLAYQGPPKFKFQTLMKAAGLSCRDDAVRIYVQAAVTCPELAAECYYKIYLRTGGRNWLFLAGEKSLKFPTVDIPYRDSYYGKNGLIQMRILKQWLMIELNKLFYIDYIPEISTSEF